MHHLRRTLAPLLLAAVAVVTLEAAGPVFWQVSTEADWLAGDAEALSIDAQGRLRLGPSTETLYEATAPFLWNLVSDDAGNVWAGSGNDGQVFHVSPAGDARVLFDAEELEVHALALAPGGALYAGTSPDGRIYRLTPDGVAQVFFDPDAAYVWALEVTADGTVFAATGEPGNVYRITPDGMGAVFYETGATHAMSLELGPNETVLVGTATPGRILRLDANGQPFVLLDSPYGEVRRLRRDAEGVLYAAALGAGGNGGGGRTGGAAAATSATTGATVTVAAGGNNGTGGAASPAAPGAGAVYRVMPDGGVDRIWQSTTDAPYDVLPEPDGSVLVATGTDGKIFRLAGDPLAAALLVDSPSPQVTALTRADDGSLLYATANPARIRRLSAGLSASGTYESSVRDARTVATWGTIAWRGAPGGGAIALATRSGNTSTPDDTWSEWSAPYADPAGSAIVSPRAQYIQWRATLTAGAGVPPVLDSVTTAYLPRNTRPQITSITLHPPGTVFQETFPSVPGLAGFAPGRPGPEVGTNGNNGAPALGRAEYQQGLQTIQWDGRDEDGDELRYTVHYRREADSDWTVLRSGLANTLLVWDTASVPNGRYILRIEASDAPDNSLATRLTGSLDSEAFVVDNTPPTISVDAVAREGDLLQVRFTVRDGDSSVAGADFSLDGNLWQAVFADDGIPDSRVEAFTLEVDGAVVPPLGVVLRARDRLNNAATAVATPAP